MSDLSIYESPDPSRGPASFTPDDNSRSLHQKKVYTKAYVPRLLHLYLAMRMSKKPLLSPNGVATIEFIYQREPIASTMHDVVQDSITWPHKGPTLFGHVISVAALIASQSLVANENKYFVLLIITCNVFLRKRKWIKANNSELENVVCPVQPGITECGYYILKFMKAIVDEGLEVLTNNVTYTDAELDMVREEWCSYVTNFVY
ncbi:hypothetical protein LXL04_011952 [Taraxacum kok-saghyz]